MILSEKILTLRKKNGWSQEELAEKLNVTRQSVSKWEIAASIPDIGKILLRFRTAQLVQHALQPVRISEKSWSWHRFLM